MSLDGRPADPAVLDALAAALAHRGPDGQGRHRAGAVGLVQTRLAIIDLTSGDQPFRDPASGCALVANGEIYNDIELRRTLADVSFASASDCEPPLYLYQRLGAAFADRLRGMYAIAIHDPGRDTRGGTDGNIGGDVGRERLILVRDPFGIKPLYYVEGPHGFAFASEAQALVAAGLVAPGIDRKRLAELLQLQFTTGTGGVLAGIGRVLPGETLIVEAGRVVARRRRPALPEGGPGPADPVGAVADWDRVLAESVEAHQRSDVPYGLFLSGGLDSSAVLAMMARLNPQPVRAYTAWFPGTRAGDEREVARAVARAVGADHVEVPFTENDFWRLLPAVAASLDDPAADYATLPTYALAAAARADAVKVILSGEGGDELLAGYGRYRSAVRPWPFRRSMRRRGTFDGLGVLRPEVTAGWRDGLAAAEAETATTARTRLQRAQAADCAAWLPNDLLTKLDRCLMAHGVEGRVPFLDPAVAAFAFLLPDRFKLGPRLSPASGRGLGKWVLRHWLARELPASRPFARKRGFTVPVGTWIGNRGRQLGPLVARRPEIAELCRPGTVEDLFLAAAADGRKGFAAWTLLFHTLWWRRHVDGRIADGGVFDVLA